MIVGGGLAPVAELRAAGVPVGSAATARRRRTPRRCGWRRATRCCSAELRHGPTAMAARDALEIATRGGAGCLGRDGEIGVLGRRGGDLVCWRLTGVPFAGALTDPVEAWLRCGPVSARHTVVNGRFLVEDGSLTVPGVDEMLARHRAIAVEWAKAAS